jgi:hypothetical protein
MSFNGGAFGANTVSERAAALRLAAETQRQAPQSREMDNMPESRTGVKRKTLRTDEARSAVGSLNQKLDEALDVVREAMLRERDRDAADRAERSDEAGRAPALNNPRSAR